MFWTKKYISEMEKSIYFQGKNDRENSIFFQSRSQKKRLTIRSKSELAFRVERDWQSDQKRIVRSDFDLFRSSLSILWCISYQAVDLNNFDAAFGLGISSRATFWHLESLFINSKRTKNVIFSKETSKKFVYDKCSWCRFRKRKHGSNWFLTLNQTLENSNHFHKNFLTDVIFCGGKISQ